MKNSIATSLEQSKLLLELGIDPNTASMCRYMETPYITDNIIKCCAYSDAIVRHSPEKRDKISPAWTLGDLISILPNMIVVDNLEYRLELTKDEIRYAGRGYIRLLKGFVFIGDDSNSTLIDIAVKAIVELKKKGVI